jgi:isoprenylcysteine carboxyl methyltransferase (ICMT) family protein YpbQ
MVYFNNGLETFNVNWSLPVSTGGIVNALFLGFSAAMLFQVLKVLQTLWRTRARCFPKTLRNMWAIVSFCNTLLLICIIPLAQVENIKNHY